VTDRPSAAPSGGRPGGRPRERPRDRDQAVERHHELDVVQDDLADDLRDAMLEGDRPFAPGTARAAFSHPTFRTVYLGAFASNIGTWMQNVVLGALAYDLTRSGVFVGIMTAAQLGPLLLFSVVGGMLADAFDRKKMLMALSVQQAVFSLILAVVTLSDSPNKAAMVAVVFCIGVGNALYAPIFSAVVPVLVPRVDMPGAISLNSVQMNASRVVGPAIGVAIYTSVGQSWVFVVNALSFAFVIASLLRVTLPAPPASGAQGLHRLVEGFHVAKAEKIVGQCLVVIFTFSFLCLPFITQMPKIASDHLDIAPKSSPYGFLYACFGLGAVIGALSIGTVFAAYSKEKLTRIGLLAFAAMLVVFGALRAATPAYVVILVLGAVYFAVITSLSTVLQQDLDDRVRGKVMALWIMGFGGTVPFGGLLGGWAMEQVGILPVLVAGAAVAVGLAYYADFGRGRRLLDRTGAPDRPAAPA
jgi:MFS family permease